MGDSGIGRTPEGAGTSKIVAELGQRELKLAHKLAFEYDAPVLLIDKREHIGDNPYSRIDPEMNIEYHVYGSHIFDSNKTVWDFVNKSSSFNNYRYRVF